MKKSTHFFIVFSIIFFLGTTTKILANATLEKNFYLDTTSCNTYTNNAIGVWKYTILGLGSTSEYKEGILFVRKEKDFYVVEVRLENGIMTGQDVEVKKNSIKFNLNIEGIERVSVVLKVEGDTLKGKTYSGQGTYEVQGTRQLPPE